jgi:membrane protease YdiL (CAAX protease family)
MVLVSSGAAWALWTVGPGGVRLEALLRPNALPRIVVVFLIVGTVGALVATVGLISYVVRGSTSVQRAQQGYGSIGTILACFAVAVILANVLVLPYGIVQAQQHLGQPLTIGPGGLVLSIVSLDGSLLLVVYFRIVRTGVFSWSQMGLTSNALAERVRQGVLAGIFVIVVSALIEQALSSVGVKQTQAEMFAGIKSATPGQFVGVLLAVAVIAPVCEEIFFRGYVFTAVARQHSVPWAFGISSVLFALAHLNLQALGPILVIGVTFSFIYWRTGSLVPSMVAHAMNNALAMTLFYLYG